VIKGKVARVAIPGAFFLFLVASLLSGFDPGRKVGSNFISFSWSMIKILPCAFILIGLFDEWVKRETIERYFGADSGPRGFLWAILLSGTTVGGLYVAFPVASALYSKGARLDVIFTYIGASAICRIPMTIFEASFMGVKYSAIRLAVSLPLVVLSSVWLGGYLEKRKYHIGS
jgi:uncharacterized membrane protein YraQ (UPF0718 family)